MPSPPLLPIWCTPLPLIHHWMTVCVRSWISAPQIARPDKPHFFEPLRSPAIYSKSCVMCAGLWTHTRSAGEHGDPRRCPWRPPTPRYFKPTTPCSSSVCPLSFSYFCLFTLPLSLLSPPSSSLIICPPEVEKTNSTPSRTQGAIFEWWQQLCNFSIIFLTQREVSVRHESASWQKLALSGVCQ